MPGAWPPIAPRAHQQQRHNLACSDRRGREGHRGQIRVSVRTNPGASRHPHRDGPASECEEVHRSQVGVLDPTDHALGPSPDE